VLGDSGKASAPLECHCCNQGLQLRKAIFSAVIELDRKGLYPTHSRVRPFLDSDLQKQWVESGQFLREAKRRRGIPTRELVNQVET